MRKLLPLLAFALFADCTEKSGSEEVSIIEEPKNILKNLTYSVDTVVVNPGEEIINLKYGLIISSLSPDHQKLYKLDGRTIQLQEINLDKLALTASYPFENEGPNGVGSFGSHLTSLGDERFLFSGPHKIGKFSKTGELSQDFDYSIDKLLGGKKSIGNNLSQFAFVDEKQMGFFLETNYSDPVFNLVTINFKEENSKVIDLPEMDVTHDFRVVLENNGNKSSWKQSVTVQAIKSKVYITTEVSSGLYRYDPVLDSLEYITFPLTLTATEKTRKIKNEVFSAEERKEQTSLIDSEVRFNELLWDDNSNQFFRFSSILIPSNSEEPSNKSEVFLSAFDSYLNLIGEKKLEELFTVPENAFFKDGKLWSYVNVEDELGFAVFTFNF
ncbi:DUF4221 domain-containing protein [Algoriphagus sp. AGSA1]|uniref:DUF4221 family protein n=1 Tax=Algoriphagus sp. AGSA1 TaxID=2907213 RepID=UPI001F21EC27|nr:DUF4221 family protein [Algoriphagus sp. AGSA1]MCE7055936.1 DUF4221 domain-containing protein [Algoriphagus sp. AGSA1]